MSVRLVPVLACLLPAAGVLVAFELSAGAGTVPRCFPFIEGCTSISSTGRQPPGSFWFKGMMIPGAVFMAIYWKLTIDWLRAMGDGSKAVHNTILIFGLTAAIGLIYYNMVLGHLGEHFRMQRRIGVILYFGFGYLAQLILTSRLYYLRNGFPEWIYYTKAGLCVLILAWGWMNVVLSGFYSRFEEIEDIFEWNVAILNNGYYFMTYFLWRSTCFRASMKVKPYG